jgi:cytochrome c biogenesis protein CcdA/thiol-disulfide isomerase/thioredoxin
MPGLIVIGIVAGIIAGISPCILPVLPVVLVAGPSAPTDGDGPPDRARRRRRALLVVAGLVVSFCALTLAGSAILSALHLPQDLLRDAGLALLGLLGLGLLVPAVGNVIERPFARVRVAPPRLDTGGFLLGLALGAVFVPCAGPVLATITSLGAMRQFGFSSLELTLAFGVGVAIPLLIVAFAGDALVQRVQGLRRQGPLLRRVAGGVLLVMAAVLALNLTDGLQRSVPGYTTALQNSVEGTTYAKHQLDELRATGSGATAQLKTCPEGAATLSQCGPAPNFRAISAWLQTPGDRPLTLAGLRGHVVLVDFWTYSCINCQRTIPHVEAWYRRYAADGLVVVGVHTPEFAFEHVASNVRTALRQLGVTYPVAVDDDYGTWNAYDNDSWPAEYLIDATGHVRAEHIGEGNYPRTESLIRDLLVAVHPSLHLPSPTEVADRTPTEPTNPETYVGYERDQYLAGTPIDPDHAAPYSYPASLSLGEFALSGTWTVGPEEATAGSEARLELGYEARDVYLVIGGHGTVQTTVDGGHPRTIAISGIPRLYTLVSTPSLGNGVLQLRVSPGVQAYDFTFG